LSGNSDGTALVVLFSLGTLWLIGTVTERNENKNEPSDDIHSSPNTGERDHTPATGKAFDHNSPAYSSLSDWEKDLLSLWSGSLLVEFTYKARGNSNERRSVILRDVLQDGLGRIFLRGHCQLRNEQRTFNTDAITTLILCANKRYGLDEFLSEKLDIAHGTPAPLPGLHSRG